MYLHILAMFVNITYTNTWTPVLTRIKLDALVYSVNDVNGAKKSRKKHVVIPFLFCCYSHQLSTFPCIHFSDTFENAVNSVKMLVRLFQKFYKFSCRVFVISFNNDGKLPENVSDGVRDNLEYLVCFVIRRLEKLINFGLQ